jgi:hypothetical protein
VIGSWDEPDPRFDMDAYEMRRTAREALGWPA